MNDYVNSGDTTELLGRHPLYVKPSTLERFLPTYRRYALTSIERASLIARGLIKPNTALEDKAARIKANHDAWNARRMAKQRIARRKKRGLVDSVAMSGGFPNA